MVQEWGWLHRPTKWQGYAGAFLAAAFCVHVLVVVDQGSHSASDTFYGIFPYVVPTFLVFEWIAGRTEARTASHS